MKTKNPFEAAARSKKVVALVGAIARSMPLDARADRLADILAGWGEEERACAARCAGTTYPGDETWAMVVAAFRGGVKSATRAA